MVVERQRGHLQALKLCHSSVVTVLGWGWGRVVGHMQPYAGGLHTDLWPAVQSATWHSLEQ